MAVDMPRIPLPRRHLEMRSRKLADATPVGAVLLQSTRRRAKSTWRALSFVNIILPPSIPDRQKNPENRPLWQVNRLPGYV